MIKIAIVDDEQEELAVLNEYFLKLQQQTLDEFEIHLFSSSADFLSAFDCSYDLISLDIEIDDKNGIDIAKEIRKLDEEVTLLFVTNIAQMAIKGYEVRALDFIVKPINYYSFSMKISTAINIIKQKKAKNIVINTSTGMQMFSSDDLYYAEVMGHELFYHTKRGVLKQRRSLSDLESMLAGLSFKRCNQSYLVNLKYVEAVVKNDVQVAGDVLKISRPKKKEFLQDLANYMGGIS